MIDDIRITSSVEISRQDKPSGDAEDSKDPNNLLFLSGLPEGEREEWLSFAAWIREADLYSEREAFPYLHPQLDGSHNFERFESETRAMIEGKNVADSPHASLLRKMKERFEREGLKRDDLQPLIIYMSSLKRYTKPGLVIPTWEEYDALLHGLSSFFLLFPSAPRGYRQQIADLGSLDQSFNNLRDMHEDLTAGINYFPLPLLAEFGIRPEELVNLVDNPDNRFVGVVQYLLTSIVPPIKTKAEPMLSTQWQESDECPYAWRLMIPHNLRRYEWVEHSLANAGYNGRVFGPLYRAVVKEELAAEQRAKSH